VAGLGKPCVRGVNCIKHSGNYMYRAFSVSAFRAWSGFALYKAQEKGVILPKIKQLDVLGMNNHKHSHLSLSHVIVIIISPPHLGTNGLVC
jgi:hypothetical protein